MIDVGSISAALSYLVCVPPREELRGKSAGYFPEQRLVIEPMMDGASSILNRNLCLFSQFFSFWFTICIININWGSNGFYSARFKRFTTYCLMLSGAYTVWVIKFVSNKVVITFMLQVSDSLSDPAPAMAAEERKTKRGVP